MSVAERTDHDRLTFAPMRLTLGGEPREVRPLPIKHSRTWKKQVGEVIGAFTELGDMELFVQDESKPDDPNAKRFNKDAVPKVVGMVLEQAPDRAAQVVLGYLELAKARAGDAPIDREWFDEHVTDEEIAEALVSMIEVTVLPFARKIGQLATVAQALRTAGR